MSHVDEGTLHGYLDGELPSSERAALEAHLAQCASCRATLNEERALLERASALLGSARPPERAVPPFDQLRPAKRSAWRVRTPVAWAASIALALGIGYYLNDAGPYRTPASPPRSVAAAEDRAVAAPAPVSAPVPARAQPQAPAPTVRREEKAPDSRQSSSRSDAVAQNIDRPRADSAARTETASGAVALRSQVDLRRATPAPVAAAAPRVPDSVALDEVVVTGSSTVSELRGRLVATEWRVISRGAAASLLGAKPVGLPGLATRRIRRSPGPDSTVVVEQALDSSTVIQIFQRPATTASSAMDSSRVLGYTSERDRTALRAFAPADRLARYVGTLRVEITGPLSQDSLNRLLEQVEPLP